MEESKGSELIVTSICSWPSSPSALKYDLSHSAASPLSLPPRRPSFLPSFSPFSLSYLPPPILPFRPLCPSPSQIHQRQDAPSAEYFLKNKLGGNQTKLDTFTANLTSPTVIATQCAAARARLGFIEAFLASPTCEGGYLGGASPSHADACLFGVYAFSRFNPDIVGGVWEHEDLKHVREWVRRMTEGPMKGVTLL